MCSELFDAQVISQLRVLSRSVATGSKFDRELWSTGLSPVLHLWRKINQVGFLIPPPAQTQRNTSEFTVYSRGLP